MDPGQRGFDRHRLSWFVASALGPTLALALTLEGCAASQPPTVLAPDAEDGTSAEPYFNRAEPFAVLSDSSGTLLATLEPAVLGSSTYLRLWYMVENDGTEPFQIDPQSDFSLRLREKVSGAIWDVAPEDRQSVIEHFDDASPARAKRRFERDVAAHDAAGKWMEYYWADRHGWDQRHTLLHHQVVYAGSRVHGFAYFRVPMRAVEAAGDDEGWTRFTFMRNGMPAEDFDVEVRLDTPSGMRTLAFHPENSM